MPYARTMEESHAKLAELLGLKARGWCPFPSKKKESDCEGKRILIKMENRNAA